MNGVYHMNREHYMGLLKLCGSKENVIKYVNESYNICFLITDIIVGD